MEQVVIICDDRDVIKCYLLHDYKMLYIYNMIRHMAPD
jgi:hypothetical protein